VAVPAAKVWELFTDVERVAPCLPGATLLAVDGDEFTGAVKVKVGPITVSYRGEAVFQEKDPVAQRVVLKAVGKETRGNGTASAVVTAQLKDEGDATAVFIATDLTISGKAAQFGRGVLADVSSHLIAQFARSLETDLLGGAVPTGAAESAAPGLASSGPSMDAESVDLLKVVAAPLAKRIGPVLGAATAAGVIGFLLGRRKRRAAPLPNSLRPEDLHAALLRLLS
jgi:carbon monoxide dehydrogenase subunit G